MRIAGLSNMYSYLNTPAMRAYNAARSQSSSKYNNSTSASSRYGNYNNSYDYRTAAVNKVESIYEDTKSAAQKLRDYSHSLMDTGKNDVYAKAQKTGDTKEIVSTVKNFVDVYNDMVKGMSSMGDSMSTLYGSQLSTSFSSHKDDLAAVGVRAGKGGQLEIDQAKLAKADAASLQKAFGGSDSFAGKASVKSIYVEANAVSRQTTAQFSNLTGYNRYGGYSSLGTYGTSSGFSGLSAYASALGLGGRYGGLSSYGSYGGYSSSNLIGSLFNAMI